MSRGERYALIVVIVVLLLGLLVTTFRVNKETPLSRPYHGYSWGF
jgi:hypothetical protein